MRIRVTADQLSPAQMNWLSEHLPAGRSFLAGEIRLCAEFVPASGPVVHREVEVSDWVRLVRELNLISLALEVREPRPEASVMWRQPRRDFIPLDQVYGGYTADL